MGWTARDSTPGCWIGYGLDCPGFDSWVLDRLWAGLPRTRLLGVGSIHFAIQLNSHLYLASRLRMGGAVPLLLPYAFIAFTRTLLTSPLCLSWRFFMILYQPWQCLRLLNPPLKLLNNFPLRKLLKWTNVIYSFISEEIINLWSWIQKGQWNAVRAACEWTANMSFTELKTEVIYYVCMNFGVLPVWLMTI